MGKILEDTNLGNMFRARFLNTHFRYLNSISDILDEKYGHTIEEMAMKISVGIIPNYRNNKDKLEDKEDEETRHFRNLRNSWYHECALNYPTNPSEAMKFPVWKVIQCYSAVLSSISSLVRCIDNNVKSEPNAIFNFYANRFLTSKKYDNCFAIPLNFLLDKEHGFDNATYSDLIGWSYGKTYHLPIIKSCLEETQNYFIKNGRTQRWVTIPHYLRYLREWINYEDSYLFFRMYGSTIQVQMFNYLIKIAHAHCVQTELFLIKLFGFETVKLQYDRFSQQMRYNIGITPISLKTRFDVYSALNL